MDEIRWHRFDIIESTNTFLRQHGGDGADCAFEVAVSAFQTAGHGQKGNSWESASGKNLLFSVLAHPSAVPAGRQFLISQAISLAVSDCVAERLGPDIGKYVSVKWPNDIYWKEFKMGGILIENSLSGSLISDSIVGVGLDVNQTIFLSDAPNPVSMAMVAGHEFELEPLLNAIVGRFLHYMALIGSADGQSRIDQTYHSRLFRKDGWHRFCDAQGVFEARICGVEPVGCLVLETRDGEHRTYEFKQVRFVL